MKDLLNFLASSLVDNPENIEITEKEEERTDDGLATNYIEEIYKLNFANQRLLEELERLKIEQEDNQKTIENLYQQISSLKELLKK